MKDIVETNFAIGQVVRHKHLDFRGVIFDVDPEFNNTLKSGTKAYLLK